MYSIFSNPIVPFAALINALIGLLLTCVASASTHTLRVGTLSDITTMDPHYSFIDLNLQVHSMIFDRLIEYGPNKELLPGLARKWSVNSQNANEWIFELEPKVRFQSGDQFTKDDVTATFERMKAYAPHATSGYISQLNLVDMEKTIEANRRDSDPHLLRIITKRPFGFLPSSMASIFVMSKRSALRAMQIDAADTAAVGRPISEAVLSAFASGELLDGTGPYSFKEWSKDKKEVTVTARTDDWQKGRRPWHTIRFIGEPSDEIRAARLLNGEFDIIANVANSQLDSLRAGGFQIEQTPSQRVIHLQLYQKPDGRENDPLHVAIVDDRGNKYASPFVSSKIRQAFALAIDKSRLVRVMNGQAVPTDQLMLPGRPGHLPDRSASQFNLAEARRIFAEASAEPELAFLRNKNLVLTIHGPNDRYPNDALILEEVARMWTEAFGGFSQNGNSYALQSVARPEPKATYFSRIRKYNVGLLGGGIDNGHIEGGLRLYLIPGAGLNYMGYQNPEVTDLYNRGIAETDFVKRDALLTEAARIALGDFSIIPLYNQIGVFAFRPDLSFVSRIDEVLYANQVTKSPAATTRYGSCSTFSRPGPRSQSK